jgi:hypothetical protein
LLQVVQHLRQQLERREIARLEVRARHRVDRAQHADGSSGRPEQRHADVRADVHVRAQVEQRGSSRAAGVGDERREAPVEHAGAVGAVERHRRALLGRVRTGLGVDEAQDLVVADELADPGGGHAQLRPRDREQAVDRVRVRARVGESLEGVDVDAQLGRSSGQLLHAPAPCSDHGT